MILGKSTLVIAVICFAVVVDARPKKFDLKEFLNRIIKSTFEENESAGFSIGQVSSCSDYGSWCKQYKRYCSDVPSVRQYCQVTCNLCPKPTTTTTTTPKPIVSSSCKDTHSQCGLADERGYCTGTAAQVKFMQQNCPKTCKLCTEEPKCKAVDVNPSCYKIRQYCSSTRYSKYMRKNCVKTCGFCKTETKCGVAKRRLNKDGKFIVGGVSAQKGFYPWQVAIYYDGDFLCGGSLIDDKHVLTAAHCFKYLSLDFSRYEVVLGDHDRSKDEGTEASMKVKDISQHEEYKFESDTHDIAIIELQSMVIYSDDITPICLPPAEAVLPKGSKCYLTGWGKTRHDGTSVNKLMEVKMPIVGRDHCQVRNAFNYHVVNDRMICAGYDDGFTFASGCHGDSGGPLACEQPDKSWVLYGVVSWGSPQCNGLSRYTVFTRVSKYNSWISKKQKA